MEVFFGGTSFGVSDSFEGLEGGGINTLTSDFGFAAQANEMHRFLTSAWTVESFAPCAPSEGGSWSFGATACLLPWVTRGTKPTFGSWGLGELVRAGVVKPVSQVRSEDRLKLLVMERLRPGLCTSTSSSSEWLCKALVRSDSCCSLPRRIGLRLNSFGVRDIGSRLSGGSSASAPASSSAEGSTLAD